ncbi:hypothetical protein ACFSUI_23020 [Ralstonia solanacearum]
MDRARFAPEFKLLLNGQPIPAELRASILSVRCQTGYEGLDEVEIAVANEKLRWLDNPLFALDTGLSLMVGYAPAPWCRCSTATSSRTEPRFHRAACQP